MTKRRPTIPTAPPLDTRVGSFEYDGEEHVVLSFADRSPRLPAGLTEAERSVAHLLLAGLSSEDIVIVRRVSARTLANQTAAIFRKAGVNSRSELVATCLVARERDE